MVCLPHSRVYAGYTGVLHDIGMRCILISFSHSLFSIFSLVSLASLLSPKVCEGVTDMEVVYLEMRAVAQMFLDPIQRDM